MKVSYTWLQKFFDTPLPSAEEIGDTLTMKAFELEGIEQSEYGPVIDFDIKPNRAHDALSHRGIAKEVSAIFQIPLVQDPLREPVDLSQTTSNTKVSIATEGCARYIAARMTGMQVKESPVWLKDALAAFGQKSINNVVDATNYVMLNIGQPLHAFDAKKTGGAVSVRYAKDGEQITVLTGDSYELVSADLVIVDAEDRPIGIAGVKGGKSAEVDEHTTDIILEAANFDAISVRKTSQRLKLRTDASTRFENTLSPEMSAYGIRDVVALIAEIASGELEGYVDVYPNPVTQKPVSVSLEKINGILGTTLTVTDVTQIFKRLGFEFQEIEQIFTITPPFERLDLNIPEDLIDEVARIYGYEHIPSRVLETREPVVVDEQFHYTETIKDALTGIGFSEVTTSTFRDTDTVRLANALASDKGCLRSALRENLKDALTKNLPNADLLGISQIKIFEIGTVFTKAGERQSVAVGVWSRGGYKAKHDDVVLQEAVDVIEHALGISCDFKKLDGVFETDLDALIETLPRPSGYGSFASVVDVAYNAFSPYPYVTRDVALWTPSGTQAADVETMLAEKAGDLCVRITLFDEFAKDDRTSYAFRLVFQSSEKTLTDTEVNTVMDGVYEALKKADFEVR